MGANISKRLARHGCMCSVYDADANTCESLAGDSENISCHDTISQLIDNLEPPRNLWIMVPAGAPTEAVINELVSLLAPGDTIIDGGNTHYKDDIRRSKILKKHGIRYVDVGTSGGIWGLERGFCLMIGGSPDAVEDLMPVFKALSPGGDDAETSTVTDNQTVSQYNGYMYCGRTGAGHFVKMVHNAIEYGMMQAYAEGFELLKSASKGEWDYDFDVPAIAELWRHGSVIPSWLLDLTAEALSRDPGLKSHSTIVEDNGEGRWAVQTAVDLGVPFSVLGQALITRFQSQTEDAFANRVLSAMRREFGGHQ